jgi:hypothetical protein
LYRDVTMRDPMAMSAPFDVAAFLDEPFVGRAKELDEDEITVDRVDGRSSSFLVTVALGGAERFEVEVPLRGGVSRFHRV